MRRERASPLVKGRKFSGIEGRDYTVVFRGGLEENEVKEDVDFSWQVVDLLVLSMRSREAQLAAEKSGGKNPYADTKKTIAFDDALFNYLGESVQIRIRGVLVDPEDSENRFPWKATSPPFVLGDYRKFQRMYIAGLHKVLKKAGKNRSPWPMYTREIWICFSDGRRLPGGAREAGKKKAQERGEARKANPFGSKSGKGKIRT